MVGWSDDSAECASIWHYFPFLPVRMYISLSNVIAVVSDFVVGASSSFGGSLDVESICRPHPFAIGPLVVANSWRVLFTLRDVIPMVSVISFRNSSGYVGKITSSHLPLYGVLTTTRERLGDIVPSV
jgi:hypothetical protein